MQYQCFIHRSHSGTPELRFLDVEPNQLGVALSVLLQDWREFERFEVLPFVYKAAPDSSPAP